MIVIHYFLCFSSPPSLQEIGSKSGLYISWGSDFCTGTLRKEEKVV